MCAPVCINTVVEWEGIGSCVGVTLIFNGKRCCKPVRHLPASLIHLLKEIL